MATAEQRIGSKLDQFLVHFLISGRTYVPFGLFRLDAPLLCCFIRRSWAMLASLEQNSCENPVAMAEVKMQ